MKRKISTKFSTQWANKFISPPKKVTVVRGNVAVHSGRGAHVSEISLFPICVYQTREIISKRSQIGQTAPFCRSFEMTILDNNSREVARFKRPFNCTCRCCTCYLCCLQEIEIISNGTVGNWSFDLSL